MKRLMLLAGSLILFFAYALYLNFYKLSSLKVELEPRHPEGYYDYRGVTHIHSNLTTGSGTPGEIIDIAKEIPLDFIFFTEVNLNERHPEYEGYHGSLMVLTGGEYSYLDSRLMYYNPPKNQPPEKLGQAQVYFTDLLSQTNSPADLSFVILAHPLLSNYRWSGAYPKGLQGIEVINLKRILEQSWRNSKLTTIYSFLAYPFNSTLSMLLLYQNPRDELTLWDQLNQDHKVVGFMGSEATAKAILFGDTAIRFPSYDTVFRLASNHVLLKSELTGNFSSDRQKVLSALQSGQFYMALDVLANPKGFWAEIRSGGKHHPIGSKVELSEHAQLIVELPMRPDVPFEVVVYRDGQHYLTSNSIRTAVDINLPGQYRAVVRLIPTFPFPFGKRWIPWIYTNPFYVMKHGHS